MTRQGRVPQIHRGRASQLGLSLLEVAIYIAVLVIIGIPLTAVTLTVSRSSAEGATLAMIQERNRTAVQRIIGDYRPSLEGTTVISGGGKTLQFVSLGGFDGQAPQPGPTIRYELRPQPGRSNALILVRIDQSTGEEIVVSGSFTVDSSFASNGAGIILNLATFGYSQGIDLASEVRRAIYVHPEN